MNKMKTNGFSLNKIEKEVTLEKEGLVLGGILGLPKEAKSLIVFAHGSGSGRLSPRNNYVARVLQEAQLATLLMDLLTDSESADRTNVFDIALLADRVLFAKDWLKKGTGIPKKIGYFGASTGAGAALVAAAKEPSDIYAVVSRGGRPDLAGDFLTQVKAPSLLLVGGRDDVVIDLNQEALDKLNCEKELKIIPDATHLFEEPGTLEQVALLATDWFLRHV